MRKRVSIIAMGAAALCAAPALAAEVVDSVFQVSFKHNGQDYVYNDTTVPLLPPDACYNWYIRLDPATTGEVAVEETFRLPEPLPAWLNYVNDPQAAMQIDKDGMRAVTDMTQTPEDGWISNGWCAAEGDPLGPHSFAVTVDGGPATNFEFSVVAPEDYTFEEAAPAAPPTPFTRSPTERSVNNSW